MFLFVDQLFDDIDGGITSDKNAIALNFEMLGLNPDELIDEAPLDGQIVGVHYGGRYLVVSRIHRSNRIAEMLILHFEIPIEDHFDKLLETMPVDKLHRYREMQIETAGFSEEELNYFQLMETRFLP